jgi:hypothetical protein
MESCAHLSERSFVILVALFHEVYQEVVTREKTTGHRLPWECDPPRDPSGTTLCSGMLVSCFRVMSAFAFSNRQLLSFDRSLR